MFGTHVRSVLLVGLGLGLASVPAAAEMNNGVYIELQGGGSFWDDANVSVTGLGSGEAKFDTGWTAGAALGFRAFDMFRLEGHASFRRADIDTVSVGGIETADGWAGTAAFLGNAYFDIPIPFPVKPYVGGGAGVAIFSADVDGNAVDVDDDDTEFAWNVMGGLLWPVWRHLELDARYRYITSDDPSIDADLLGLGTGQVKAEFSAHEVVGALRVVF
ncbi:MAG TPA: outer membrane beta-barrel protein [Myxococcota bacterium]|nr:outer membrane beta-barrel protein [Myxococcota bacterium]